MPPALCPGDLVAMDGEAGAPAVRGTLAICGAANRSDGSGPSTDSWRVSAFLAGYAPKTCRDPPISRAVPRETAQRTS